jgi:hypothetical protein
MPPSSGIQIVAAPGNWVVPGRSAACRCWHLFSFSLKTVLMNRHFLPLGATLLLALGLTGCESTGSIAGRMQEKSAVYATLKQWEKNYIERGSVAVGFTPDMVYMALGRPNGIDTRDFAAGHAELWTYRRSYPKREAIIGFKPVTLTIDSAYQPAAVTRDHAFGPNYSNSLPAAQEPAKPGRSGSENIAKTGGPQGGSMEPADLPSYTIQVLFENGRVVRLAAVPNAS